MKTMVVKFTNLSEDENNPRTNFSGIKELAESIKSVGLLQPIVVRKTATQIEDRWTIVDGARRVRALKDLGLKEVQAVLIEAETADEAQMSANMVRSDLNLIERARGCLELARRYPSRYNATTLARMFGGKPKDADRLMNLAKKLPVSVDPIVGPSIHIFTLEALEQLACVPAAHVERAAKEAVKRGGNVIWAFQNLFHGLSYMSDVISSESLISAGKAFRAGRAIYAIEKADYDEVKKKYEASQKKQYGSEEKKLEAKTEKQKEAERKSRAKEKEQRQVAGKFVQKHLSPFLTGGVVLAGQIERLGLELVQRHMKTDAARALLSIFEMKEDKAGGYGAAQEAVWNKVLGPLCKTPQSLVLLNEFLSLSTWEKKSPQQAWEAGLKKLGV